jgi:hypothetical protein
MKYLWHKDKNGKINMENHLRKIFQGFVLCLFVCIQMYINYLLVSNKMCENEIMFLFMKLILREKKRFRCTVICSENFFEWKV